MPRISTDNYDTVASWNGSQDLFVVEQPDGTKVATPALLKQYVLGNSIDDIYSVMGQMGAKNLIPYPYDNTTRTANGITFTDNGDGTITVNGTATGNINFWCIKWEEGFIFPEGNYILSAGGAGNNKVYVFFANYNNSTWKRQYNITDGGEIAVTVQHSGDYNRTPIGIFVKSGTTVNNLTFKPMFRLASDTDNTYQPYAKTNRQLTEVMGDLSQTGLTGDNVAAQLATARGDISSINTALAGKQNTLTFDNTPTQNSNNPVKSGGIYTALTGKAEKNPSAFSDYTHETLYAAAGGMTITDIKGGYKKKDGICYVFMQISFTGSFGTPGAWNFVSGFPASAVDGIPIIAVPTNNDTNSVALRGGRINTAGNLFIINESTLTGGNSTAFTFIGSYPVA